jgi:ABC-2 type transport system ATP-binding protein
MNAGIRVDGLTVRYGGVVAVHEVSFRAPEGDVTCVVGRNGAGKTSTIECLEGLRQPAEGKLSVLGLEPRQDHAALVKRIGVMLQEVGIHPAIRVGEAVRHAAALYASSFQIDDLIERVGLAGLERRSFRQLSGGQQRRLALALALVGRPQVAFLDEPTAGVDPVGRITIRRIIADLREGGTTVLLTSHDLDEVERVADRVIVIDQGRLVADGTLREVTASGGTAETLRFRAPPDIDTNALSDALAEDGESPPPVVEEMPGNYLVRATPTPRLVARLTSALADRDVALDDLRVGRATLHDAFVRLTGSAAHGDPAEQASAGGPPRHDGAELRRAGDA